MFEQDSSCSGWIPEVKGTSSDCLFFYCHPLAMVPWVGKGLSTGFSGSLTFWLQWASQKNISSQIFENLMIWESDQGKQDTEF